MRGRKQRWPFLVLLASGLAAFAAFWYAANDSTEGTRAAFGGLYVEGVTGSPARINPLFAGQNTVDESLVALIFSGLTRLDDQGQPFPDLAERWEVSPDGLTYTFQLRQGVVWHDGAPFTADDVVFTYGLLQAPALRAPPALARVLAGATVTRLDALGVRIQLSQPYAPLPAYLNLGILPRHILGQADLGALFDAEFNLRPVGTGAYRLEQLAPDRAILAANAAYHFGQPYLQRLELRFFRDDGALMAAVRAGEVDGAFFVSGVGAGDYAYMQSRRDLTLSLLSSGEVTFLYLNLRSPLFQDRRVRQALLYALDRDSMVQESLPNQAEKAESPLPSGSWAWSGSFSRYHFDANVAASLLDEAGFRLAEGGVRSNGSVRLSFTLATNNDPVRIAVAQAVAERWRAIGIDVKLEAGGATTLVRDLLEPRSYQAVLFAHRADVDPDPYPAWHSSQAASPGRNISLLADARVDRVLEEARQTASQARRQELYREFQEVFAQDVPAIPLYSSTALYVLSANVKGASPGYLDNAGARFWQVQDWHVKLR